MVPFSLYTLHMLMWKEREDEVAWSPSPCVASESASSYRNWRLPHTSFYLLFRNPPFDQSIGWYIVRPMDNASCCQGAFRAFEASGNKRGAKEDSSADGNKSLVLDYQTQLIPISLSQCLGTWKCWSTHSAGRHFNSTANGNGRGCRVRNVRADRARDRRRSRLNGEVHCIVMSSIFQKIWSQKRTDINLPCKLILQQKM